ncbi:hypothetical protein Lgra_3144 [Legionella gratiana]|uniref:Uncharacterized protein n=1 Tax=Legionella gratiana TaxID=45066 RepID=A0A378JC49_9GAMM|nr:hypothetical protein [Legionella gratiana]KTD06367.1 hypothetical protein Lgra_3144 [Legionella gratiana]STX45185.1 Uncharacterised protein [Legionella gratiana]
MENNNALSELEHLLQQLEPELKNFNLLVESMSTIVSAYKNNFNYINMIDKRKRYLANQNVEERIKLIISELNEFSDLIEKISRDEEIIELYAKDEILNKCRDLRNSILIKLNRANTM